MEKSKQGRRQLRRTLTKTYNAVTRLLAQPPCTAKEISQLRLTNEELNTQFKDCRDFDKHIRKLAIDEIMDEAELDAFFNEVDEVTSTEVTLCKIQFYISKHDT